MSVIQTAVVLVGGQGARLKKLISDRPKPMADINGKPFLEFILVELAKRGVSRVVLATGFMSQHIQDYFGDGSNLGIELQYSVDPTPLGTGGAVKHATRFFDEDSFLVLNGDSFCAFELGAMMSLHQQQKALITMLVTHIEDASRFGAVLIDGSGKIVGFREKDQVAGKSIINAGIYLINKKALEYVPVNKNVSLERDVFPRLVADKKICGVVSRQAFIDIGTPESFLNASEFVKQHMAPHLVGGNE